MNRLITLRSAVHSGIVVSGNAANPSVGSSRATRFRFNFAEGLHELKKQCYLLSKYPMRLMLVNKAGLRTSFAQAPNEQD